jgi:DNA-binding XRE family transcriptional regulator
MDKWDFLKWRKTLRYTQAEAGEQLGVNRGTIQNWERGITRISRTAELACQELNRRWKQRPEFGPVTLVYADSPIWQQAEGPYNVPVLQCERYPNNDAAIEQASRLKGSPHFINPLIVEESGSVVWMGPELLRECDRRAEGARARRETAARNGHSQST